MTTRRQEDLFGRRDERIARAIAKQTERIAYKNKMPSAPSFPNDAQVAGQRT